MDSPELTSDQRVAVESWFVGRGLPNLIHDYHASTDVFTRAMPVLVALWMLSLSAAFGDRFEGWSQAAAALVGVIFLGLVAAGVNRLRGRTPFQLPDRVGLTELTTFVLTPAVLAVILDNANAWRFVLIVVFGLFELGAIWFAFGFGLGAIIKWALRNLGRQIGDVVGLMIRSLPLLLVFTMFLFMNAELWQVADDFTTPLFLAATGGLVGVAGLFVLFRLPAELEDIGRFTTSEEAAVVATACNAPIQGATADLSDIPPLSRVDQVNMLILAAFTMGVQIALVMLIVGLFYLVFGVLTVRLNTIELWTNGTASAVDSLVEFQLFGSDVQITSELLKVVGFLMAFTALQFTVSALTDATYRKEFFEDLTTEIREALAVRVLYLSQIRN